MEPIVAHFTAHIGSRNDLQIVKRYQWNCDFYVVLTLNCHKACDKCNEVYSGTTETFFFDCCLAGFDRLVDGWTSVAALEFIKEETVEFPYEIMIFE